METLDAIENRKSVRSFKSKKVEKDKIQKLVEAGKQAPSAGGLETQEIIAVSDGNNIKEIGNIALGQAHVKNAPLLIVVFVDVKKSRMRYGKRGEFYAVCDGSASVENILLAATDLGLGSCWIGAFDDDRLKSLFNTDKKPVAITPIGYKA